MRKHLKDFLDFFIFIFLELPKVPFFILLGQHNFYSEGPMEKNYILKSW
jgi:hypothetical protein